MSIENTITSMIRVHKKRQVKLKSADVFVGAGGLAIGVANAGFKHLVVVDRNPAACKTLKLNHEKSKSIAHRWKIFENDVKFVDFSNYAGKIDLLAGGPPCQPFSFGGQHGGRSDERDMFPEFIRAVREIRPQAFVIENVRGLLKQKFATYFQYLLLQLQFPNVTKNYREKWKEHRSRLETLRTGGRHKDLQYNVIHQLLNATNYGVPQNRERVFIVGVRNDVGVEYCFPLPTHTKEALIRSQWITGDYWDHHGISKRRYPEHLRPSEALLERVAKLKRADLKRRWRTVRDAFEGLPRVGVSLGQTSSQITNHFLNPGARFYDGHDGSYLDLPAKTVKAGHNGVPGGENIVCLDDHTIRYFSVRECARLQTFPDSWEIDGTWTSSMKQIGNAVPVCLAEAVVKPLAEKLDPKKR